MVDVNTQNKTISVNVSSSGVSSNVNASGDTTMYYSNKAREWAISNRIVDGVDYSSKYYAGKANESALNAQSFAQSAQDSYKQFQDSVDGALSNVDSAVQDAITTIDTKSGEAIDSINSTKTDILTDIEFVADGEKQEIEDLADVIKDNANTVNTAIEAGVERLNSIDALKNNQITNCITEIPQRIKLELADGVLTLKAGSEVIVPNGFEDDGVTPKFDYVTVNKDYVDVQWATVTATNIFEIYNPNPNENLIYPWEHTFSGETAPTGYTHMVWYDTKNNLVKLTSDGGASWKSGIALPLSVQNYSNGFVTSINQVFNGMGYIGSTVWVNKGVKGLIPNGRNEDGTLKNIEFTTPNLWLATVPEYRTDWKVYIEPSINGLRFSSGVTYISELNKNHYDATNGFIDVCYIGRVLNENGTTKVLTFNPKLPFRAVDYSDSSTVSGWGMPSSKYIDLTLGASGTTYTAPANGYFYLHKQVNGANQVVTFAYNNNMSENFTVRFSQASDNGSVAGYIPCKKGTIVGISYNAGGKTVIFRFYYAQGEV